MSAAKHKMLASRQEKSSLFRLVKPKELSNQKARGFSHLRALRGAVVEKQ